MNRSDIERAIKDEVAEWPGVTVEFVGGGKHPKAKLTFTPEGSDEPLILSRPFAGTPSGHGLKSTLGDIRRAMKQLGATRPKPEPSIEETEAKYHKPNDGAERRGDLVVGDPAPVKESIADQLIKAGAVASVVTEVFETPQEEEAATRVLVEALVACGIKLVVDNDIDLAGVILAAVGLIEDGIYFGLPDRVYHAVPRLSASGLQRLCVSPATFWRGSWLDPDRPELDEEETKAQKLGKAYHIGRLEPARFHELYVRELDKGDYPAKGFLSSDDKVKAELKGLGQQQTVTGESTEDRALRLIDAGYEGTIFPLEKAKWAREVKGRIPIGAKEFDQLVTDMERVRASSDIADLLTGGEAEVSIFYTDEHGLKCKARVDYLTRDWWDDFKTFDNTRGIELQQAIANAVRYNRYHVQAVSYRDAIEAIRKGQAQIQGNATDEQRALIAAIQMKPGELACWYIFQEKKGIPNLLAYEFPFFGVPYDQPVRDAGATEEGIARAHAGVRTKTGLHIRGMQDIDHAKRNFVLYSEVYEPGQPWAPIEPRGRLDDAAFNSRWLEGTQA